ncbi:MAG: hypothetical protein AB1466_04700 [Actinomycetota bacterium]
MKADSKKIDVENLENVICRIEGIKAARIVAGVGDSIEEIHILALPIKTLKQIARDIESILKFFKIQKLVRGPWKRDPL